MPLHRSRARRLAVSLVCGLILAAAGLPAATPDPGAATARIAELLRDGRRAEALPLCRTYVAAFPDDAVMLYNLACLENTDGTRDAAEDAYQRALAVGFDAWAAAAADPDLQGPLHEWILAANRAERSRLAAIGGRKALALAADNWSDYRRLDPHGAWTATAPADTAGAWLRLRWQSGGLEFEVVAAGPWQDLFTGTERAPWNGGPGLVLSLGLPSGGDFQAAERHFLFAFGLETKGGVGGLYVAQQGHWQQVVELAPKIRVEADGRLHLSGAVPWSAIAPYGPLLDAPLGVNATLVRRADDGLQRSSLLETADTLDPTAARRRLVPLDFRTGTLADEILVGKLSDSISRDAPLVMDLVAVSRAAGPATLSLDFVDQAGRSVLPEGRVSGTVDLAAGTNQLTRQADFTALKTGGYAVQAELRFPSGHTAQWGAAVLQLAPDWDGPYRRQIDYVAQLEQPTARHLLDVVTAAIAGHDPRRSPGAIITSLIDLDRLLKDAEDSGTILPGKGSFVFVYPGPGGAERICRMYLPAGREHVDGLNPIIVLDHGQGLEARLAARIGRNYEYGDRRPTLKTGNDDRFPVYLVPEFTADPLDYQASLLAEAQACRAWAQAYFAAPAVSLVGIDALGGTVLRQARSAPGTLRGLLVFAGENLDPWPQADAAFLREQLAPAPPNLPVTWLDFPGARRGGGQGPQILAVLKELGYDIAAEQTVRGGLNLTQIADRVVLWAEDLR